MPLNLAHAREYRSRFEAEQLHPNMGELFDTAVRNFPAREAWIAVDSDKPSLTYAELSDLVGKSANAFRDMGVKKGSYVTLMMPSRPEHLAAWLGLAKIGAVSVCVNPNYTPNEIKFALSESKTEFVLINAGYVEQLDLAMKGGLEIDPTKISVWNEEDSASGSWNGRLERAATVYHVDEQIAFEDPINILFTSGSTGFPKGCVLPHSYWIIKGKILSEVWPTPTRIQVDAPLHYMGPLWRFAVAAYSGAALCVAEKPSLSRFLDRWQRYKTDLGWINTAMAMTDLSAAPGSTSLKVLGTSGINPLLHAEAERRFNASIREIYGMTEIGLALYMPYDADDMVGLGSTGIPAPYRECMIADENGDPVPQGEIGELHVAGPGLVLEYIGRPEATAAAFRGKWFRTGDLFRQDEIGLYYFKGRIKDIIRRSAENISAVEVETAIATIKEVEEVAVGPVADALRGEEVKAFIVLKEGFSAEQLSPENVVEHCRSMLARFKLPRYIQYYWSFPHTASNKIAKRQLLDGGGDARTGTFDLSTGTWS